MKRTLLSVAAVGLATVAAAQTASNASAPAVSAPAAASPAMAGAGIAILNSQRLALESAPGKEAYARLKKMSDQKKEELDKVEKDARDLVQKLNDQGQAMPEDKRDALAKQADDKQKQWKRMSEDAQRDLQEAERKEMASLEGRIGPVVKEYFKEKKYAVVLDSRAGIIYADEATDVTDDVLKRINTTVALPKPAPAASKPAAPAAKPSPVPAAKK
jgi:Skp family chaperone for outer membrane proteins